VDGCLRIYMEYVSGGSVASAVKTYGSFAEPQAAALTYQLLQGLVYLHSRGIVHRDLKGDNLLLETSSELKIADFGTAKSVIASATMTANIVGTAYFMAPEVLRPEGQVGTPADIWSTGCCVIEMLTGKPPLSDIPNQYSVMMAIAGSPKVPLEKYIPAENTWSTEVLDFIQQCLRLKPASRPTAQELLQHPWILKYCDGEAMQTVTTTTDSSTTPKMSLMTDHHHSRLTLSGASTAAAAAAAAPTSPDDVVTATSDFAATHTPTASPHPRSPGCSAEAREMSRSATPRERKSKKEKKGGSSRRHHSRDTVGDSSRDGSTYSKETTTHGTPTPPPVGGHRHSEDSPVPLSLNHKSRASDSGVSGAGHPGLAKSGVVGSSRSHFSSGPTNVSVKDDDHQASFSYDYPLPSSGRIVELAAQSSSTFLPAIACASSNALAAAASVTTSVDGMRGTRFARHLNVGSSRDDTRAYHYPNNDDFTSRESMRLGKDFYLDGHDDGRDAADIPVRYGSTTRIPLPDPGLEPGLYSALDCLTAPPTASDLLPSATSRRTTSKRAGRGG
jgi:mitogen-activated protein kinase kinase kinase YODA